MSNVLTLISIAIVCIIIGCLIGYFAGREKQDGTIIIETTEDERERIRFVLDLELDDIKEKKKVIFLVENHVSQNSQLV